MNKHLVTLAPLMLLSAFAAEAQAQEMGRVLSTTPVSQTIAVPHQVCTNGQVMSAQPKSGAGAVMGAIAGGVIGSQFGGGSGRAAATAAGVISGAIFGDAVEGQGAPVMRPVSSCDQQTSYENRIVAYNVVYEYAGRQYSTQMTNDPGAYIPVQISAAGNAPVQIVTTPSAPPPVIAAGPVIYPPAVYGQPAYPPVVYGSSVYGSSVYGPPLYGAPVYGPALSFRYGFGGGWRGHEHEHEHGHDHGHWN